MSDPEVTTVNGGLEILDRYLTGEASRVLLYTGSPDGILTAPQGSICMDVSTPSLYQNQDGGISWIKIGGLHATQHEDGGTDEINVTGLFGLLADAQTPLAHGLANITYHTGIPIVENNFMSGNADGLPKDSGYSASDFDAAGAAAAAVATHESIYDHTKLHDRQHSVTSTDDHTFPGGTDFLRSDGTWQAAGDVTGPGSATDNAIVRFDGTTGKLLQNSAVTMDDTTGLITTPSGLTNTTSALLINDDAAQDVSLFGSASGAPSKYLTASGYIRADDPDDDTRYLEMYVDSKPYIQWNGLNQALTYRPRPGGNAVPYVYFYGGNSLDANFRCYDRNNARYLYWTIYNKEGYIRTDSSGGALQFQNTAHAGVKFFSGAAIGETPGVEFYGYPNVDGSSARQQVTFGMSPTENFVYEILGASNCNILSTDMHVALDVDSLYTYWGAARDMSIGYDGADALLTTDLVNPSDLVIDCGTDKTIELAETVWNDVNAGSQSISLLGLFTGPDAVELVDNTGTGTGISAYGFAVGEEFSNCFELEHEYAEGTDIYFHVHWVGQTAPTGTDKVKWQLTYCICRAGVTTPAATVITYEEDYDTQYEWKLSTFAAITGTTLEIGDQFMFKLERVAASADEYGGDAVTATVGIHMECNTVGSRQIIIK